MKQAKSNIHVPIVQDVTNTPICAISALQPDRLIYQNGKAYAVLGYQDTGIPST